MDGEGQKCNRWLKIFFVLLSLLLSGCGSVILFNNLEESEVNEMIAILKQYGISSEKIIGKESCALSLSVGNFSTAIDLLGAHGYPLPKYQTLGDVFKKSGLVSSPLEERIRFMNALGEGIALTLSKIPGVLKARVHVVLPDNDPYAEKTVSSSASVFIAYRQDSTVEDSVREIKYLVSNSVEGLDF
jgi:type III secretion protein J